jgi:hypothetical protein
MRRALLASVFAACVALAFAGLPERISAQDKSGAGASAASKPRAKRARAKRTAERKPRKVRAGKPERARAAAAATGTGTGSGSGSGSESGSESPSGSESATGSAAQAADPNVRTEGDTQVKVMEFSGLDIEGQLKTPQMLYFLNRMRAEFGRPRLPHRSFMPELQRSTRGKAF